MTSERPAGALQICASRLSLIRRGCLQRRNTLLKRRSSVEPCCFRLCEELGSCPRSVVEDCRNCGAAKSPKQNKYGVAQKTRRNINSREKRSNIPTKTSVYKTPLKCSDSICGSSLMGYRTLSSVRRCSY